jgi:hypothetical protein
MATIGNLCGWALTACLNINNNEVAQKAANYIKNKKRQVEISGAFLFYIKLIQENSNIA